MSRIRLAFIRRISFQGDEAWCYKTAQTQLSGAINVGPGRFVISEILESRREPLQDDLEETVHRETVEEIEARQADVRAKSDIKPETVEAEDGKGRESQEG